MEKYHKIQSIFKRDPDNGYKFTDEYSKPEFEYLADNLWVATEKIDGRNHRIIWDGTDFEHKGKSDNAQMPDHLMNDIEELATKESLFNVFRHTKVCLYGEAFGPKIQSGGKYADKHSFILFDVKIGDWWLRREHVVDVAKQLEIKVVPKFGEITLGQAIESTKKGFDSEFGDFIAEGLILKPETQLFNRKGKRIVTKIKHKDFKYT